MQSFQYAFRSSEKKGQKAVNQGGFIFMLIKRAVSVILTLCLMLGLVTLAAAETDTSTTAGVDVVIVLDMSVSMRPDKNDATRGNDPYGYRIDATSMLIGMMDMDGSRVAIVPFAQVPGKPMEIEEFTDISDRGERTKLIEKIYAKYLDSSLPPNTNIGAALMKAEQMLLTREDKTNSPMIVLMTDGKNDIKNTRGDGPGSIKVSPSLRWENNEIVDKGEEDYDTETADVVTREAFYCAQAKNIPIYTVALGQEAETVATNKGVSLVQISRGTGALECQKVNQAEAAELPAFFAKILANQIGSSVEYTAKPEPVPGTANTYEVKIPILNKEVLEANIILPVKAQRGSGSFSGIDQSFELLNSTGESVTFSEGTILLHNFNYNHFAMIKIREPDKPGMWTLRFKSDKAPDNISFNILYKYNIKLQTEIENANGSDEYYKTDSINVKARFIDENENYVSDTALYEEHTGDGYEPWMTIHSDWKLYRAAQDGEITGDPLKEGRLNANTDENLFETTIDLTEGGKLKSGSYMLVITASGAGLDRTVKILLELKNHPPAANDELKELRVNSTDASQSGTWTVNGTSGKFEKTVYDLVTDQDGDELRFGLTPVDDAQSYAVMTLDDATGTISYNTVRDTAYQSGEKVKAGKPVYKLTYNDQDGGKGEIRIGLDIISEIDILLQKYTPEVSIDGETTDAGTDYTHSKNVPVTFTVRLKDQGNGTYADSRILEPLGRRIDIADLKSGNTIASNGELKLNDAGDGLEHRIESTGNKEAEWQITVSVSSFEDINRTLRIPNDNAPVAAISDENVEISCDEEKVPSFLTSVIGTDTPEDDPSRIVKVKGLFSDQDGDIWTNTDPVFIEPGTGEKTDGSIIWAEKTSENEEAVYTIRVSGDSTGPFRYTLNSEMHITATDGDGKTGDYIRKITIVDLYNKMITYLLIILIALAVLIVAYLIIHQIRKPVFPALNMTIREEPSLYESGSEKLSPVKSYTNLNALGVDGDMANKHGISLELLQNIIVRPLRSRASVGVTCKKPAPGHSVMLEDVKLKPKKTYTWKVGQELLVNSENGEGLIAVKLEDRPDDDGTYEEFTDNEWSEIDENTEQGRGRKHSRKAERKAPPAEEQESSGGSDDFDF